MTFKEYSILSKEEYLYAAERGLEVEVFSNLETLQDVYGYYIEYIEITYIDDAFDMINEN